jgi:hypothetical protein
MKPAIATLSCSLAVAAVLVAPSASAAYRCDNPQGIGERRACVKAAEGPVELRRFIERTRGIYGLYYADFLAPANGGRIASQRVGAMASAAPTR